MNKPAWEGRHPAGKLPVPMDRERSREARGWVCYDAECAFCLGQVKRFQRLLERNGFVPVPLQSPEARAALGVSGPELLAEMRVVLRNGEVLGGADAAVYLVRFLPVGGVLTALARLPGMMPLLRQAYRWVARNRSCSAGACQVDRPSRLDSKHLTVWLPLMLLLGAVLMGRDRVPSWGFMWALGYQATNAVFIYLVAIYVWTACKGGAL